MLASVAKNVAAQIASLLVSVVDRFLVVGVLLRVWGPDLYSAWATAVSAAGLLLLLELGFNIYFGNAMQCAWTKNDAAGFQRMFSLASTVPLLVMGTIAVPLTFCIAAGWASGFVPLQPMSEIEVKSCLAFLALASLLSAARGGMAQTWRGRQKFALGSFISIAPNACIALGVPILGAVGGQPVHVAAFYLLSECILGWGFGLWMLKRYFPDVRFELSWPTRIELRDTVATTRWLALLQGLPTAWLQLPILLLAHFSVTGSQLVSFIALRTLTNFARTFVTMLSFGSGVEIVTLHHAGRTDDVTRHLVAMGKAVSMIAAAAGIAILVFGQVFVAIWTERNDLFDFVIVGPLLAGTLAVSMMSPLTSHAMFAQDVRPIALTQLFQLVLAVGASLLLIPQFGVRGAAFAFGAAEVIGTGLVLPHLLVPLFGGLRLPGYILSCLRGALVMGLWSFVAGKLIIYILKPESLIPLMGAGVAWTIVGPLPILIQGIGAPGRRVILNKISDRMKRRLPLAFKRGASFKV